MDAKPQRPLRSLYMPGDENAAPASKQPNLQKHKSTGNLSKVIGSVSNMSNIAGIKAAAKRTAFGDVSNVVKSLSSARDDSAISGKQIDALKPIIIADKPATFARPAQRPLNVATAKNNSSQAAQPTPYLESILNTTKTFPGQDQASMAAVKRTLSKRSTTVYKDTDEIVSSAPAQQNLVPRQYKSQPQLKQDPLPFRRTQLKVAGADADAVESATIVEYSAEKSEDEHLMETEEALEEFMQLQAISQHQIEPTQETQNAVDRLYRQLPQIPIVSEPEELWEEEDGEDIYDEGGYTTGGATTGGVTTVLFPKETAKTRRELAAAKVFVDSQRTEEDEEDDLWDTSMVAEYSEEIFEYFRELEHKMLPNPHYMDNQTEIQWSMRAVLMDWLIQVHQRFNLLPETLFLTVNFVDRFLSCKIVSLGKLQLVGATAIFVAAKYEEINCPSVSEIVFMVDSGYTTDEILKAERFMLSMLQFELGWPGPYSFLRRISKADEYDLETRTLAKYFMEVSIMDERMVGCPPSYIAAGAHCLSRMLLRKGDWSQAHVHYSTYTWSQLRPLVVLLLQCCEQPEKHHNAVYEKFQDRRYKRTSLFVQTELNNGFVLPSHPSRQSLTHIDDGVGLIYERRMVEI